ncbi:hypothetical protein ACR6C2_14690 [Streptomyces sp. INA 01156]
MIELAGRVSSEMQVGKVVLFGVMFSVGLVTVFNIAQMTDRIFLFLAGVLPGPCGEGYSGSLRFAAGGVTLLSLIGLVVEIRMGLT